MDRYLRIYMNDQLAQGVLWRELARRASRSNRGSDLGEALGSVAGGIAQDVATFEEMMERLALKKSTIKRASGLVAERVGRLKLNGRVIRYSPLSRFMELEVLVMGIDRKKQMWETLRDLAGLQDRLSDISFDRLIQRAEEQKSTLEPFRMEVGKVVLNPGRYGA